MIEFVIHLSFENIIRPKTRPRSASRQRRQNNRRHSLNADSNPTYSPESLLPETNTFYSGVDYRTNNEKIESLTKELEERKNDPTVLEYLYS